LLPSPSIQPEEKTKVNAFTYLVTPRLKISPDLMVYARFASGYRAGGPNTLATVFQVPGSFAPDKTQNYEIGFKGNALGEALSFDASLYYIDWKNIQLQVNDPVTGQGYVANASKAKSEGVELSIDAKPLDGMTIDAWIVWNEAVLTEDVPTISATFGNSGDRLPYASRFSGNVSLRQEFPLTGQVTGYAGASVTYVGDRVGEFASIYATPERQIYPAYAQTDLRGGAKYDFWKFNLFVNNLADKRGQLSGGIGFTPANAFTYIQPRTVGLSVEKSF
jgi:iron complex outermembrane recepter protein